MAATMAPGRRCRGEALLSGVEHPGCRFHRCRDYPIRPSMVEQWLYGSGCGSPSPLMPALQSSLGLPSGSQWDQQVSRLLLAMVLSSVSTLRSVWKFLLASTSAGPPPHPSKPSR